MEIKQDGDRWLARKNKKAKTLEDVTDIIKFDGDFASVMGKAGRTTFHSYLGKIGKRWVEMHGTTSITDKFGDKSKLIQWAVDKAVDFIEEIDPMYLSDSDFKEARYAHRKHLEDAGAHGTDCHTLVEEWINARIHGTDTFNPEIKEFIEWAVSNGVTFLASEMRLRSSRLWCAGTADFVCEINGKRYIGDLKTGNYVKFGHFVQCGAYALYYEEMGYGKIDGIVIAHMPRHGGFKTYFETDVDKYKKCFESLVTLSKAESDKSYELYS